MATGILSPYISRPEMSSNPADEYNGMTALADLIQSSSKEPESNPQSSGNAVDETKKNLQGKSLVDMITEASSKNTYGQYGTSNTPLKDFLMPPGPITPPVSIPEKVVKNVARTPAGEPSRNPALTGSFTGKPKQGITTQAQLQNLNLNFDWKSKVEDDEMKYEMLKQEIATESLAKQLDAQKQIDILKQYQNMYLNSSTPMQDLTPLISYVDAIGGTKMAANYKKPESMLDRISVLENLQARIDAKENAIRDLNIQNAKDTRKIEVEREQNRINAEIMGQKLGAGMFDKEVAAAIAKMKGTGKAKEGKDVPVKLQDQSNQLTKLIPRVRQVVALLNKPENAKVASYLNKAKEWAPDIKSWTSRDNAVYLKIKSLMDINTEIIGYSLNRGVLRKDDMPRVREYASSLVKSPEEIVTRYNDIFDILNSEQLMIGATIEDQQYKSQGLYKSRSEESAKAIAEKRGVKATKENLDKIKKETAVGNVYGTTTNPNPTASKSTDEMAAELFAPKK